MNIPVGLQCAATGVVEVLDLDFGEKQNRRVAARQPPYFLSKPTKMAS